MKVLILCEKATAMDTFAKALKGRSGQKRIFASLTDSPDEFQLTRAQGHLLELADPDQQVPSEQSEAYKKWTLDEIPWNYTNFKWIKRPIIDKRTNSDKNSKDLLERIRKEASDKDAVIIATDTDPSGEGDVIGWEILNYIGWNKKVYRIKFEDSVPSILKGLENPYEIIQAQHGRYMKGLSRQFYDFLTMQYTRVATLLGRKQGYDYGVVRTGRLKAVIVGFIAKQWQEIDNYVKIPFYEARYRDENNYEYARKYEVGDTFRHTDKNDAIAEAKTLTDDVPVLKEKKVKRRQPPSLLDLSMLAAIIHDKGFATSLIESTYQNMYEQGYVSYPRTADTKISQAQFDELLPLANRIAEVVGIDTSLLTHRTLRNVHGVAECEHGPNRPGLNVPKSLRELEEKFDKVGVEIYKVLAKSFLSILAEDYVYEEYTGSLENHPEYITKYRKPIELNFLEILGNLDKINLNPPQLGTKAKVFIFTGSNKKPPKPTARLIFKYLKKFNVGTGATRLSTLNELGDKKSGQPLISAIKGAYKLTSLGKLEAAMLSSCYLSNPLATKKLQELMDIIEKNPTRKTFNEVYRFFDSIFAKDFKIIQENALQLPKVLGKVDEKALINRNYAVKRYHEVMFNGVKERYKTTYIDHTFTESELAELDQGNEIKIKVTKHYEGKKFTKEIVGRLAHQELVTNEGKAIKWFGFKEDREKSARYRVSADKQYRYWKTVYGHTLTEEEAQLLEAGEAIQITDRIKTKYGYNRNAVAVLEDNIDRPGWKNIKIISWGEKE